MASAVGIGPSGKVAQALFEFRLVLQSERAHTALRNYAGYACPRVVFCHSISVAIANLLRIEHPGPRIIPLEHTQESGGNFVSSPSGCDKPLR